MKNNEINNPSHYTDGRAFQPKDVIRALYLNFNLGNVVKYISRAGRKPGESKYKDLSKAKTYLGFEIEYLKTNPHSPYIHVRDYTFYLKAVAEDWGLTEEEKAIIKCIVTNRFNWPILETAYKQLEDLCKKCHALEMFEESKKADDINEKQFIRANEKLEGMILMMTKRFDVEYIYKGERFKAFIEAENLLDAIYLFYASHGCTCKLVCIRGDDYEINCDIIRTEEMISKEEEENG